MEMLKLIKADDIQDAQQVRNMRLAPILHRFAALQDAHRFGNPGHAVTALELHTLPSPRIELGQISILSKGTEA